MLPVVCVDDKFEGFCKICRMQVSGKMVEGEFVTIEDKNVCVTGSMGQGDCGHTCTAIGSSIVTINDKKAVLLNDPVTGDIEGKLVTGSDFCFWD